MNGIEEVFSVFLTRLIGGYALCFGLIGPSVTEGSWRRVSLFTLAGLSLVALFASRGDDCVMVACGVTAAAALVLERLHAFRIPVWSSPRWILPFGLWVLLANEWPPGLDTFPSAIVLGGTLGAMLLGHSYLTVKQLGFGPLRRMAWILFVVLILRVLSVTPAFFGPRLEMMDYIYLMLRCGLGLFVPLVLGWMVIQCVRIESNQSATGILYAMTVLVGVFGELIAVYLRMTRGIAA